MSSTPDPILVEGVEAITDAYRNGTCVGIIGFSLYREPDGSITSRQVIACAGADAVSVMAATMELNSEIKKMLARVIEAGPSEEIAHDDFGPAVYVERPGRGNA